MARLYHAGAEVYVGAAAANPGVDANISSTVTRDTSVFRSGLASWKCDSTGSNLASRMSAITLFSTTLGITFTAANSPYYFRAYFRVTAAPSTTAAIVR